MLSLLKKIDRFLDRHTILLILFGLIIVLRLPNFFEPYWYGDEAIYLTIGNALNHGGLLYTTIIDHKTPLIYLLAMVPNQFYFRLLNLVWMLFTTAFFFRFAKALFSYRGAILATFIMVVLTSIPTLEGNIPNGELFVMGFVMLGGIFFIQSSVWQKFFGRKTTPSLRDNWYLLLAGASIGMGILTKVPAVLDLAVFLAMFALIFIRQLANNPELSQLKKSLVFLLSRGAVFMCGVLLPILLSVAYFVIKGRGADYLDYGLLYNFRYSQSWSMDFGSQLLNFIFSLRGKTFVLFVFFILITLNTSSLRRRMQLISLYFIFALYAVLLSSRPYPHYFMQMVPAFALLVVEILYALNQLRQKWHILNLRSVGLGVGLIATVLYVMLEFGFHPYSTTWYYGQFLKYATLRIDRETYENSFNWTIKDNKAVNKLIQEMGIRKMFIWGTNPLLYAQSQTIPTSRFTVSFHIKDFQDQARTFTQIQAEQPELIVVMKNESDSFPQLEGYLAQHYIANHQFETMTLYLRHDN